MNTIDELIEAFPAPEELKHSTAHKALRATHRRVDAEAAIQQMQEGRNWHDNMVRVVGSFVARGWPDEAILMVAQEWRLDGYSMEETKREVATAIQGARNKGFGFEANQSVKSLPQHDWPSAYNSFDGGDLPKRQWIYDRHYLRGFVSVLASAGGIGKTSLQVAEALAIASGRDLLGEKVHEQTNVWLINLEDPMEEMKLRIVAAMQSHGIRKHEVEGRLYVDAGRDFRLLFASQGRAGVETNEELAGVIIEKIKNNQIGAVFIDPFVGSHAVNENDNMAINAVVDVVRRVADATNCAIGLVHHMRKANGQEADVDSIRGAGSLIGAARVARVANKISKQDASKLAIDEKTARSVFRVENGKANLSPPVEDSIWRILKSHKLENGEHIGVVHAFDPPMIKAASELDLRRAQYAIASAGKDLRSNEAADDWAGYTVARELGIEIGGKSKESRSHAQEIERVKIRKLLKELEHSGRIQVARSYSRRDAREVPIYTVNDPIDCEIEPQLRK